MLNNQLNAVVMLDRSLLLEWLPEIWVSGNLGQA